MLGKILLPSVSQKTGRAVGNREVNRLRVKRRGFFFPSDSIKSTGFALRCTPPG